MEIIGRTHELQELSACFSSEQAEFVVVYGRRRVGKTFLIEQVFKKKRCLFFYVSGIQNGDKAIQLKEFAKAISETFYSGVAIAVSNHWMDAFEVLTNAIDKMPTKTKVVLFFDELPWMATKRSQVLEALDYYWNRKWSKDSRIKLIVCGSSASWIIKNIINNKGGLHNRYTKSLLLKPFSLYETKLFLESQKMRFNDKQILQLYTAMGGVPHYLKQIKKNLSAVQNINNLCFHENGLLFSEFEKLFKSLFKNAKKYIELIKIIAKKREGVSRDDIEKQNASFKKGGSLTDSLNDLELAGFIKRFLPLHHTKLGEYYRVIDEYSYFYLHWIEPEKRTLISQEIDHKFWIKKTETPGYWAWLGYAFESVCYKHITQIREALDIDSGTRVGAWRYVPRKERNEKGAQIDLLFERDDLAVTLCEIKCTEKPFVVDKAFCDNLMNKIKIYKSVTRTENQILVGLISANGVKNNKYLDEMIDGVVTLEDLIKK